MLSVYLILVNTVFAEIENFSTFGSESLENFRSGSKSSDRSGPSEHQTRLKIDEKKLEQLQLCQATLEQIIDPSEEDFQKTFYKVCFRKSWKNHLLYLNKVITIPKLPNLVGLRNLGATYPTQFGYLPNSRCKLCTVKPDIVRELSLYSA